MPARSYLGIEIGGTKLQATLGDATGAIHTLRRGRVDANEGAPGILAWVEENVATLLREAPAKPRAAGIGFGGPVDAAAGTVLVSHQIQGWDGFPLRDWLAERVGVPVVLENDANTAGWAEYAAGAGKGTRHCAYMNIGSGIGGALIIDGRLHNGQGRGAGEIGHTRVPDWTASAPGVDARLEDLCSGWAIERRLRQAGAGSMAAGSPLARLCGGESERLTCAMLGQAASEGDPVAREEMARIATAVGVAVANVITLAHPERVVLGGGVSLLGEVLLAPLREAVAARVFGPFRGRYTLVPCAFGEDVVTVGALLLAAAVS
jgi:glucokinase